MAKHPVCQQHLSPSESAFYDSCESPLKSAPTSPREEMFCGHCDSLLRAVSSVSVASPEIIYCDVCGSPQSPATVWPPKPEWAQQLAAYESQGRYHAMAELGRSHLSTTHGPHAVALRLKLAGVYDSVCNLAEAKALLEQVLEEHPGHPKALADLARLLEVQRDWTGLAALYRQALERVPDPEAQVSYTRQLARLATWRLRDSQLAIMYWRRVLARQEDREAREALTRFYEELGEQEALAELRRSDPKASSAHQAPAPRRPVSWPRVPDATPRRIAYGMVHMLGGLSMHLAFGAALMIITTMLGLMVLYITDQLGEDELYLGAAVSGLVALIGLGMALVAGSKLLTQLRLLTYGLRATGIITEVSVNPNRTVNEQPATRIVWEYEDADGQTQTGHTDCFDAQRIALHPQGTEVDVLTLGTVPSMVPSLMGIVFWVPRTMSEAPTAASPDGSSATIADGGTLLFTAVPTHSALVEQLMALFAQRYGTSAHLRRDALAMNRVEEAAEQVLDILATQSTTTLKLPFLTADAQGPQHLTATVNVRPSSHQAPALHNPVHLAREPWPLPEHLTTTAAWPLHGQPVEARRGCLAPRASLLQMGRLELADEGHTLLRKGRQGDSLARLDLDVPFATHLSVWQRSSDQVELTVSLVERGAAANRLTCRVALTQACVGSTVARQRSSAPFLSVADFALLWPILVHHAHHHGTDLRGKVDPSQHREDAAPVELVKPPPPQHPTTPWVGHLLNSLASTLFLVGLVILPAFLFYVFGYSMKHTDAYACALKTVKKSSTAKRLVGKRIQPGTFAWLSSWESSGSRSEGHFSFSVSGSKGSGSVWVDTFRSPSRSSFVVTLTPDGGGQAKVLHKGAFPSSCVR